MVTHHAMQIGQQLTGCTCNQAEIYPSAVVPYMPVLLPIATKMTRDATAARDLVQDTLMRAVSRWLQYRPGTSVRAWLVSILQHTYINAYRQRRRHERTNMERPGDVLHSLHNAEVCDRELVTEDDHSQQLGPAVARAIAALPAKYRDVLVRADIEGQRYRDIASALDIPIGSVMNVLYRARKALEVPLASAAADYGLKPKRRVSR